MTFQELKPVNILSKEPRFFWEKNYREMQLQQQKCNHNPSDPGIL